MTAPCSWGTSWGGSWGASWGRVRTIVETPLSEVPRGMGGVGADVREADERAFARDERDVLELISVLCGRW